MNQVASAAQAAQAIVDKFTQMIVQPLIVLLFSLGTAVFLWGLIEFIYDPTDPTRKETGKKHMIYGILGLLIMVSLWGIVRLVLHTLGIDCSGLETDLRPCQ